MSKTPGLAILMQRILENRRELFEPFIIRSVTEGLRYREKRGNPIRRTEIEKLNGLIREVGFKFPELWDVNFLTALDAGLHERAMENIETERQSERIRSDQKASIASEISALSSDFYALFNEPDKHAAGYKFEKVLNCLFRLSGLNPREPFRVTGEQIDGSFELDHEIYLLEAKWEQKPSNEATLLIFRGKIEGKSQFTRGVFISLNGITDEADQAITKGKQPNFFTADGYDLSVIMQGHLRLADLLRHKLRKLAEEGKIRHSARDILATYR